MNNRKIKTRSFIIIIVTSAAIGLVSALFADTLKILTEHYEHSFFATFQQHKYLIFVLPLTGLLLIHALRKYLFKNQQNKGIKEVLNDVNSNKSLLTAQKVPSHYFNGFLTVAFGGSTGIEVSTVVATATIGSLASTKVSILNKYKTELICTGLAAGITALFSAPLAGVLFAFEVFSRKISKTYLLSLTSAISVAYGVSLILNNERLFDFNVLNWNTYALPYIIFLGIVAGVHSAYLTKSVLFFKKFTSSFKNEYIKVIIGSLAISTLIYFLPSLYGDGFSAINHFYTNANDLTVQALLPLVFILLAKPIITSITLSIGGDGGVFAPSLFIGAFLGIVVSFFLNHYFHVNLIAINFVVIGMAAVLSGSIHAPFTSIFLVCSIIGNYHLFIPILIACLISKLTSHYILPYTVYTYNSPNRPKPVIKNITHLFKKQIKYNR